MTSQGAGVPYRPGERIPAYQACVLRGNLCIRGADDNSSDERLTEIAVGDSAVFRYVESRQGYRKITIEAEGTGAVAIYLDQRLAGTVEIENGCQKSCSIQAVAGKYEMELRIQKAERLEIRAVTMEY